MKMPIAPTGPGPGDPPPDHPKLLAKLPRCAEFFAAPTWDDGTTYKGERTVWVCVSRSSVKLLVKVENPPLKMMVSGRTWDDAWAALELALKSDNPPWEWPEPTPEKGAKKKK